MLLSSFALVSAQTATYGTVHLDLTKSNKKNSSDLIFGSRQSYIGFKGISPLDHNIFATFKFEIGFDATNQSLKSSPYTRYSFLGLRGSHGEIRVGKQDSAYNIVDNSMEDFLTEQGNGLVSDSDTADLIAYITKFGSLGFYGSHMPATKSQKANTSIMVNYAEGSVYAGVGLIKEEGNSSKNGLKLVATYKKNNYGIGYIYEKCGLITTSNSQLIKSECQGDGKGTINHISGIYRFGKPYIAAQIARNSNLALNKSTLELGIVLDAGTKVYFELDKLGNNRTTTIGLKTSF